jgi:hypothetical protein
VSLCAKDSDRRLNDHPNKDSSPDWLTLSAKQETDPARKESGETAKARHSHSVCRGKSNFKPKQGGKLQQVLP